MQACSPETVHGNRISKGLSVTVAKVFLFVQYTRTERRLIKPVGFISVMVAVANDRREFGISMWNYADPGGRAV
jgi:hypothetical protein